jgi:hypothetical protein
MVIDDRELLLLLLMVVLLMLSIEGGLRERSGVWRRRSVRGVGEGELEQGRGVNNGAGGGRGGGGGSSRRTLLLKGLP